MDRSEVIEDAKAALAGWRPIDCAPRDGSTIILGFSDAPHGTVVAPEAPELVHRLVAGAVDVGRYVSDPTQNYWGKIGWFAIDDDVLTSRPMHPTHWQPLPPPPSA